MAQMTINVVTTQEFVIGDGAEQDYDLDPGEMLVATTNTGVTLDVGLPSSNDGSEVGDVVCVKRVSPAGYVTAYAADRETVEDSDSFILGTGQQGVGGGETVTFRRNSESSWVVESAWRQPWS